MKIEQSIIRQIDDWITRADECLTEYEAWQNWRQYEDQDATDPLPMIWAKQDLFEELEYLCAECVFMIKRLSYELKRMIVFSRDLRAAWKILRSGEELLRYDSKLTYSASFLRGMVEFFRTIRDALQGFWYTPAISIIYLSLDGKTTINLFVHNGIATIGQLQNALHEKRDWVSLNEQQIEECKQRLIEEEHLFIPLTQSLFSENELRP
jgi:hypothetical protein